MSSFLKLPGERLLGSRAGVSGLSRKKGQTRLQKPNKLSWQTPGLGEVVDERWEHPSSGSSHLPLP